MGLLMKEFAKHSGKITLEDIKSLNAYLATDKAIKSEVETYGGSEHLETWNMPFSPIDFNKDKKKTEFSLEYY